MEEAEGAVFPRAPGDRGASLTNSKILFIASFDVYKEPPISSNEPTMFYECLQIPLLSAPSARFDYRHNGPHFAVLPLDLENLSAALLLRQSQ